MGKPNRFPLAGYANRTGDPSLQSLPVVRLQQSVCRGSLRALRVICSNLFNQNCLQNIANILILTVSFSSFQERETGEGDAFCRCGKA